MSTATAARYVPTFATVPRLWPGSTIVVIGGGSSLTPADVDYCRGKARVIAIKEAYQLAPWADVLYAADAKWWRFYQGAPTFDGLKYSIEQNPSQDAPDWCAAWPDVAILRNKGDHGLSLDPSGLCTGHNSGYQAVNLAVHLGAAKIVLLGFDMWRGPSGEQNWFGKHPNHVESPYPLFLQSFATIVAPLKQAGVEVLNASRFTILNGFPRVPLEEALP
jgi:hypothetical protein